MGVTTTLLGLDGEFPIVGSAAYLNHAASSPLPRRSADALRRYVEDRERLVHLYQTGRQDYDCRPLEAKLGRLLGAPTGSVGFAPTTTDGVSGILNSITWAPGDNVLVPANEFPGVLYACQNLARRGVEVRQAPVGGHLALGSLFAHADRRTRAVVVSHVHWQSGHRIDLARLAEECRAVGALSIVDAIQSAGAVPIDATAGGVDVLVAGTYKWLMGIPGAAVLYVGPAALATLVPDRAGWTSMATSVHDEPKLEWAAGAGRFLVGGRPDPILIALEQSVDLLLELGVGTIAGHTGRLIDRLIAGAGAAGVVVRSSTDPAHRSSIVSITTGNPSRDASLVGDLAAREIIVARRGDGIRVSPHCYNTAGHIDRLLEAIASSPRT
ncbi:MAG: aminotransferase class V-fold PLP-dependent enzyme [Gemmatimonadetes bacterium]|nr:aminotransferase class V-fold PLP-dependent enzyme [Gemmatimonadota bacterium]